MRQGKEGGLTELDELVLQVRQNGVSLNKLGQRTKPSVPSDRNTNEAKVKTEYVAPKINGSFSAFAEER